MYIFDKNALMHLGFYYPSRFPTIWDKIEELAESGILRSVREVRKEIEFNCPVKQISEWVKSHHHIFMEPTAMEIRIVTEIFSHAQYRGLVKRQNILRGLPVADPFIIAAGSFYGACVVTQESLRPGARIPTVCEELKVECTNIEGFLENEGLSY